MTHQRSATHGPIPHHDGELPGPSHARRPIARPSRFGITAPLALVIAGMAAGCSSSDRTRSGLLEPYRVSIPQGNYVNQQMLDQVRPGMSREQVRLAIGSPLLTDAFHPDRWDYVFRFLYANGESERRKVTIHFDADKVSRIEADPLPARDDDTDPALPGFRPRRG